MVTRPRSLPILTFHAVDEQASALSFSPTHFQYALGRLHEKGYRTLNLPRVADYLKDGMPFPENALVITFDDGYRSVYDVALPVLQCYQMTATVFVTVGEKNATSYDDRLPSLHGREMLSWREISEMQQAGMNIGAHTLTHPDLIRALPGRSETEILGSKWMIEDRLGVPVEAFAYPFGRYDSRSRAMVNEHFRCAVSDRLGLVGPQSDAFALERVEMYYFRTPVRFSIMLGPAFRAYMAARRPFRQMKRFIRYLR